LEGLPRVVQLVWEMAERLDWLQMQTLGKDVRDSNDAKAPKVDIKCHLVI
jgi:hypothetical protein